MACDKRCSCACCWPSRAGQGTRVSGVAVHQGALHCCPPRLLRTSMSARRQCACMTAREPVQMPQGERTAPAALTLSRQNAHHTVVPPFSSSHAPSSSPRCSPPPCAGPAAGGTGQLTAPIVTTDSAMLMRSLCHCFCHCARSAAQRSRGVSIAEGSRASPSRQHSTGSVGGTDSDLVQCVITSTLREESYDRRTETTGALTPPPRWDGCVPSPG